MENQCSVAALPTVGPGGQGQAVPAELLALRGTCRKITASSQGRPLVLHHGFSSSYAVTQHKGILNWEITFAEMFLNQLTRFLPVSLTKNPKGQ